MNKYSAVEIPAYTSEHTGIEYPKRVVLNTAGKLVNIGKEYEKNIQNGKQFIINTVEIPRLDGKGIMTTSARCFEGNYDTSIREDEVNTDEMEVGQNYLTTVSFDEEGTPYLQMSHLPAANRASIEDFAGIEKLLKVQGFDVPAGIASAMKAVNLASKAETTQEVETEGAGQPA